MVIVPFKRHDTEDLVIRGCFEDLRKSVKEEARGEIWDNYGI